MREQMSNYTIVFLEISCIISSKFPEGIPRGRLAGNRENHGIPGAAPDNVRGQAFEARMLGAGGERTGLLRD